MAAPSYALTNYAGTTTGASDMIGLVETRLTSAGWVFVEEYAYTSAVGSGATATTTSGSTTLSSVNSPSIQNGWSVGGTGIPAGTYIVSGGGTATQVMSQAATASGSSVALTASRAMRIWKNPASLNAAGVDFYVGFIKDTTGGPRLSIRAFEGWDTTGKTIQNPVIQGNIAVNNPNSTTYAGVVATNGVGTGSASWNPTGVTTPAMLEVFPTLTQNANYDVGILASKSYLVLSIAANGSSTTYGSWVIGLYNPTWTDSQATYPPLMICDLLQAAAAGATTGISRCMRLATTTAGMWSATAGPESLLLGQVGTGGLTREKASQTVRGARVALGGYVQPFTTAGYRGVMYDAMTVATDGNLKLGDTVNVGGTTWTLLTPSVNGPMWLSQVPSSVIVAYFWNTAAGS